MNSLVRRNQLFRKDYILKPICMEIDGCFPIDAESGGLARECAYVKLMDNGYTGAVLCIVEEKDFVSMNFCVIQFLTMTG